MSEVYTNESKVYLAIQTSLQHCGFFVWKELHTPVGIGEINKPMDWQFYCFINDKLSYVMIFFEPKTFFVDYHKVPSRFLSSERRIIASFSDMVLKWVDGKYVQFESF